MRYRSSMPNQFLMVPGIGLTILLTLFCKTSNAKKLPNIVLIVVDDLGYGELGCQGNKQIPTPHIDSIAKNGVRFTQGYVTASYCSQSRAGLLTGRHQVRFGYLDNPIGAINDEPNVGLPLDEKTLATHLRDNGYVTGLIGKWHLGASSPFFPLRRGFDEFFGFLHEGHYYGPSPYPGMVTWLRRRTLPGGGKGIFMSKDKRTIYSTHMGNNEPIYDANNPIYRGGQPVEEKDYLTDAITREATGFVERNTDKPFFLMVSYNAVHSPMQGADPYMEKFKSIDNIHRRIFAAMLSNMDDSVGAVLDKLREQQVMDNTLIILLSDNGGPTRELTSSNKPLRAGKGSLYEGGIRVPFMMQWKGKIPQGMMYDRPVSSLDLFATAKKIAGFKTAQDKSFDGVDLIPFVNGENKGSPHKSLFWLSKRQAALRRADWKIVQNLKQNNFELFNLKKDVGEETNVARQFPAQFQQMREALESETKRISDDR